MNDITFTTTLLGQQMHFETTWGLFSPEHIDTGTQLLLDHLGDIPEHASILDLGCGYGPIGLTLAKRYPSAEVTLVDVNFVAVEYAQRNANLNHLENAHARLSNGFQHLPEDAQFDLVLSNLPAKIGRELTLQFFSDAHAYLRPGGRIVVVTVNGLREFVKRTFTETFGQYKKLKQGAKHVVTQAIKE